MTIIRLAIPDDAQAIREVGIATWWATYTSYVAAVSIAAVMRVPWSIRNILRSIENTEACVFVAEVESEIIGVLFGSSGVRQDDFAFIERWYVRPDMQGKKIGYGLWQAYLEGLPTDAKAVELDVFEGNQHAIRFYERLGFIELRRFVEQIADHDFPLVYLRKTL